jgi:O-antigen ligase
MAESAQECPFPSPRLPFSGESRQGFGGYKSALALAMLGAGAAALFFCAHWSIVLLGAVVALVLSAVESEPFILFIIFLTPLAATLKVGGRLLDGPSALHSLVIVGFFLGRFWRGGVGVSRLLRSSPARASLFLLGAMIASIILPKNGWTNYSVHSLYRMGACVGFFFLVLAWADSAERVGKILRVLLYSTMITAVFAIVQEVVGGYTPFWLYLNPSGDYFAGWEWRAPSFLNYSNSLAGYLNLVLPFALACYVLGRGKWKKLAGWTLGLGFVALLSTQSLGGLVAFFAILVLAVFCFAEGLRKRLVLVAGVCSFACVLYLLKHILNPTHRLEALAFDAAGRLILWQTAWSYFIHSPLMGVGWGNFVGLYGSDLSSFSSFIPPGQFGVHNIYLQLLAETGLVGFVAFFYLIFQSWRQAQRQFRSSIDLLDQALAFGVVGALLSVLVHGFVEFLFQVSPQFGTLFWVILALLVGYSRLEATARRKSSPGGTGTFRRMHGWK